MAYSMEESDELRAATHRQVKRDTIARIENNPLPTREELRIGMFYEMLEPQVRNAVFVMNRKGYRTSSSGFWGRIPGLQHIDGRFRVSAGDREQLASFGVRIYPHRLNSMGFQNAPRFTYVEFEAPVLDLETMRKRWDEIAVIFTARKRPARRRKTLDACLFRYQFGGEPFDMRVLERFVQFLESHGMRGGKTKQLPLLREAILRGDRNLLPLGFPNL